MLGESLASAQMGRFRYNSPWTQVIIVGFVAFCSVGMYSAIGGLGAGGTQDVQLSDIANSVLYGCFFIGGFVAGSINNILGPRLTMSLGTTGYSLYLGSLWCFQLNGTRWFLILAGGILGFSASLFWAAQGSVMMSYPMEKDKGRSFTVFWVIFQMGTFIGAAIALGIQFNSTLPSVSNGVYIAFMIIMLTSIASSWLVLSPEAVVRGDGTLVELEASLTPKEELHQFIQMFKDWRMVALFPMFFTSNYFYAYQGAITAALFNGRTRALVSLLTGLGSMIGSIIIGTITDVLPFGRRNRALVGCVGINRIGISFIPAGCAVVFLLTCAVYGGGVYFQTQFTRESSEVAGLKIPWDWTDKQAAGPIVLLWSYYTVDATFQGLAYYTMSSLTNDSFKLARMAGYYKGIQSAGAAVSFGMDAVKTAYLGEALISWLLMVVSFPLCILVLYSVRPTNYEVEHPVHVEEVKSGAVAVEPVTETPMNADTTVDRKGSAV